MFGRKAKVRKAVDRSLARVEQDGDLADHEPLEALPADLKPHAYFTVATALHEDEHYKAAKHTVTRLLELVPHEPDAHKLAGAICRELGDVEGSIAAHRHVVTANPRDTAAAIALADLLISVEQLEEALAVLRPLADLRDREVDAKLAEALFVTGKPKEALTILDRVCAEYESQLREPWSTVDRQGLIARAEHATRLRQDVYAELHGREATIELAASMGHLDAKAGVNYRLLGARLAAQSGRVADVLDLQDPDTTEQRARARGLDKASALALLGSAQLRRGHLDDAHRTFERATELDGRCFPAFYGIGAVLDHEKYGLHRRAARLEVRAPIPPELAEVVPDWPALTEIEQTVVRASTQPFAALLPTLADRGVKMCILPIDVRATDIGLFEHVAGARASDDHRSYDALGGVATARGAIAKIEELLDVIGDHGWTFAHELAHLAYFHMADDDAERFHSIYQRARQVGYANTDYALKNDHELFAVSYTEYLRSKHGLPGVPIRDDAGIQDALQSYFAALCERR